MFRYDPWVGSSQPGTPHILCQAAGGMVVPHLTGFELEGVILPRLTIKRTFAGLLKYTGNF